MAENRTINIDIKQNADQVSQDFTELNDSVKDVNKSLKETQTIAGSGKGIDTFTAKLDELDKKLASGTLTTREMNKLMKEYQTVATQAGTETPVGDRAIKSAASLKDTLADLSARTKLLSSDYVKMDTTLAAIGTGAEAFSGITSAMALTGVESEELQKTMVKLQAVQGVANSISAVTNALNKDAILGIQLRVFWEKAQAAVIGKSTGALKVFKVALASTGIGLLVAAIGLLIANFDKLLGVFQPVIDGLKSIGDAIGLTDFAGEERAKNEKRRNEEEARQLEKVRKARENAYNNEQKAIDRLIALRGAEGKSTIELQKQKTAASIAYQKELLKEAELALEVLLANERRFKRLGADMDAVFDEQAAKIEELKNGILDNENELKLIDINAKEERKNREKDLANYTIQLEKEKIDAMEDGMQKRIALLEFQRKEELKGIDKNGKKAGEYTKAIEERYLKEIQKVKDEYRDRSDRDDEIVLEKKLANRIEVGEQEIDAEKYVQSEIGRIRQEENDKEIQRRKDLLKATTDIALQGLDLIASIAEANAGEDEKRQRAAFNIRKASNIAQATVDGYKAVLSTYADTPGGVVIKTIAATIAGGFAALKIGQIAKSKYESSSSGGGGGDLASGGTESFAPQFNVIGNSGINQLAQLQQQPVQAYVVSGEVTSAQALDRNRQKNATL